VRAAFGEGGAVVTLTVQSVDGEHDIAQVTELVEQRPEAGDLVSIANPQARLA
jgi:hypothetical protein